MASDEDPGDKPWRQINRIGRDVLQPLLPVAPPTSNDEVIIIRESQRTEPHERLEDEIPALPGQVRPTEYLVAPPRGENDRDVTSFVPGQAFASETNLPRLFRLMCKPRDHADTQKSTKNTKTPRKKRPDLMVNNSPVRTQRYLRDNSIKSTIIKDFPILPRYISTKVEGWRIQMWRLYDPDITYGDIRDRFRDEFAEAKMVSSTLSQRVFRFLRSDRGGQLSEMNRNDKKDDHAKDIEIMNNQFKEDFENLGNTSLAIFFNQMARDGRLNRIYWNTPWKLFRYTDKDTGNETVLVQDLDAEYKQFYFEADIFDNEPEHRERPYRALWQANTVILKKEKRKKPGKDRPNREQKIRELDDYYTGNFEAIAMLMKKLDAEHLLIQQTLARLAEQYSHGPLVTGVSFQLAKAKDATEAIIRFHPGESASLGLNRKWYFDSSNYPDDVNDPINAAETVKHTIVDIWTEFYGFLESWDATKAAELKFSSIQKGDDATRSVITKVPLAKNILLQDLARGLRLENDRVVSYRDKVMTSLGSAQNDEERKSHHENLSLAMERLLQRWLDMIQHHANTLGLARVYVYDPVPSDWTEHRKHEDLRLCLVYLENLFLEKLETDAPNLVAELANNKKKKEAPSKRLREVSLQEYQTERKRMKSTHDDDTRQEPVSLLGYNTGNSPTNPHATFMNNQLRADRLINELDVVLRAHGKEKIPTRETTLTTFAERLQYVVNTLGYEDVLGHYRISEPVLRIIEGEPFYDHRNARDIIARATDDALMAGLYITTSFKPNNSSNNQNNAFYANVANALRVAMPRWVAHVRFMMQNEEDYLVAHPHQEPSRKNSPGGSRSPTVSPLADEIGQSPTNPHPENDKLNPLRLNQELDRVLQAHGKTITFTPGDTFINRIRDVVKQGYEDVMGHNRIAWPIIQLLRDSNTPLDANQTLADAVDTALLNAGYADVILPSAPSTGEGPPIRHFQDVADQLEAVLECWREHVRFEIQNDADYLAAHPTQDE